MKETRLIVGTCLFLILAMSLPPGIGAQPKSGEEIPILEPVVVTATRTEVPLIETPSAVTIITAEEIKSRGITEIHDAIKNTPGIHTAVQGTKGGFPSLFTRGAESDHTLVMIDGIPINRDGGAFFDHVALENIDRIEIVRGPGSILYGSSALAGTINIITRTGFGPPRVYLSIAGGTFRTSNERFGFSGGDERINYSLTFFQYDQFGGRFENSDYHNTSLSGTFGLKLSPSTEIRTTVDWQRHDVGVFSNTNGPRFGPTDPDARAERDNLTLGTEITHRFTKTWESKLKLSRLDADRLNKDQSDPGDPFGSFTGSSSFARDTIDFQNNFYLAQGGNYEDTLVLGAESQNENLVEFNNFATNGLSIDESRQNGAIYLQNEFGLFQRIFFNAGARLDDNEVFGTDLNWKVSAAFLAASHTKIRGTTGTGIKAPTLFENFDSQFGNRALGPEKSFSWEVGIEQGIADDRFSISITYFDMTMEDLIQFKTLTLDPFTATFVNAGEAESRGWEVEATARPWRFLRVGASYAWLDTEVTESNDPGNPSFLVGKPLLRRPRHSGRVQIGIGPGNPWQITTDLIYVGKRDDASFASDRPPREVNPAYTRADMAGSYFLAKNLKLFGRIENLFNKDYDEVLGHPNPGFNLLAGLEVNTF